jgi:SAM-dependent methyltransferase
VTRVAGIADRDYVAVQYRDASNLNARIALHRRFSTNPYGLTRWIFDRFQLPPDARILELGCGPGGLWAENGGRIPDGWRVCLSDRSIGMARTAAETLAALRRPFRFAAADAQAVPFADAGFDAVIADHMLYHVPDRARALGEIRRVLRPGGRVYASTVGAGHLRELAELMADFDPALPVWGTGGTAGDTFTLENGAAQLERYFTGVALHRYEDSLEVTDPAALVNYLLSGRIRLAEGRRRDLEELVRREVKRRGGTFHVTKETGLFEAVRG